MAHNHTVVHAFANFFFLLLLSSFPGDDEELADGAATVNHTTDTENADGRSSREDNQMEGVEEDDNKTETSLGSDVRPSLSNTPMDDDEDQEETTHNLNSHNSSNHNSRACDLQSPSNGSLTVPSPSLSPKREESPGRRSHRSDSLDHLDRSVIQSPASSVASDTIGSLQHSIKFPALRLNAQLASDPALQPDAKALKGTLTIKTEPEEPGSSINVLPSPILAAELRAPITDKSSVTQHKVIEVVTDAPRIPIFMCTPCGIRFSSLSTLEAHQTYYCTHRKDADEASGGGAAGGTATSASGKHPLSTGDAGTAGGSLEPPMKSIRTGKQYACNQCSYSADKKVSLNRHKRMHQTSPAPSSTTSNGGDFIEQGQLQTQQQQQQQQLVQGLAMTVNQLTQVDRYCTDCDIRFNSMKTYRAHKQHYCSSRHREG